MVSVAHGGRRDAAARSWGCPRGEVLDLSTGVYPLADWTPIGDWLKSNASLLGTYPDPDGEPARSALASELSVDPECVLISAGAQAVIEVLFRALEIESVAIAAPEYGEVKRCASRSRCDVRESPLGADFAPAQVRWVTSPHSMTAMVRPAPSRQTDVLDESYASASTRRSHAGLECLRVGSLTKAFSLPGLRLGYLIGASPIIENVRDWLPPWPAPTLGLHLLPRLLQEWDALDAHAERGVQRMRCSLERQGWEILGAGPSFVLGIPSRPPAFEDERILVRQFPEWPSLHAAIRIGLPGSEREWQRLERAL